MCCSEDSDLAGISWFHAGFLECPGEGDWLDWQRRCESIRRQSG